MKQNNLWQKWLGKPSCSLSEVQRHLANILPACDIVFSKDWKIRTAIEKSISAIQQDSTQLLKWEKFRQVFLSEEGLTAFEEPFPDEYFDFVPKEMLCLLTALSIFPNGEENYRRRNIPVGKFHESLQDLRNGLRDYVNRNNTPGLSYDNFAWFALRLVPGHVLRFGRLEFNRCLFFPDILVFRNINTKELRIMLNAAYPVNANGHRCVAGEHPSFCTSIPFGFFGEYTGHLINADGCILREKHTLWMDEWECILSPGVPVWGMHIPSDGPLLPELVNESFVLLRSYDPTLRAVICGSWLFDPVLPKLLPFSSNLVKFQKIGHLLPGLDELDTGIERVFGNSDYHAVTWKTMLQKAMGRYLDNGGLLRNGRIVIPFGKPLI